MTSIENSQAAFTVSRVPLETRRRRVTVRRVEAMTPSCRRVTFGGVELEGFSSPGGDDHVRVFFPPPGAPLPEATDDGQPEGLQSRELTPAAFDEAGLAIDFLVHGDGAASRWAASAQPGDEVFIGGPRRTLVIDGSPRWWLLGGDLTALPAIRRLAAAVPPGVPVDVVLLSDDAADVQPVQSPGELSVTWVHPAPGSPVGVVTPLIEALAACPARPGDGFAFIAAEQAVVEPARALLRRRGVDLERAVVKGYWKRGVAEYHAPKVAPAPAVG